MNILASMTALKKKLTPRGVEDYDTEWCGFSVVGIQSGRVATVFTPFAWYNENYDEHYVMCLGIYIIPEIFANGDIDVYFQITDVESIVGVRSLAPNGSKVVNMIESLLSKGGWDSGRIPEDARMIRHEKGKRITINKQKANRNEVAILGKIKEIESKFYKVTGLKIDKVLRDFIIKAISITTFEGGRYPGDVLYVIKEENNCVFQLTKTEVKTLDKYIAIYNERYPDKSGNTLNFEAPVDNTKLMKKKQELEAKFEEFINNMSSNAQKINDRQYRIILVKSSTGGNDEAKLEKAAKEWVADVSKKAKSKFGKTANVEISIDSDVYWHHDKGKYAIDIDAYIDIK